MPPKNMTSVIRNIHIPSVDASFCWWAVSNCSRSASVFTSASLDNFDFLSGHSAVVVRLMCNHWNLFKIMGGRWRRRLPFQTAGPPRVGAGHFSITERPGQINGRYNIAEGENRGP